TESVSRTLETCYDNYAAAIMARKLGKEEDALLFEKRASYYKNMFDPATGLMRPRLSDSSWYAPFNPYSLAHSESKGGDYTEGNAWQYTWHVQHDVKGLMEMYGSKELFKQKLDSLFSLSASLFDSPLSDVTGLIGQYAHGNEPSHHIPYLFNVAGYPARTQELIREIFDTQYKNKPDGLCGNDDCGQMSAWYMFSAMGFYPLNPVGGEYILGAPQMERFELSLPHNKKFIVIAEDLSKDNKYVEFVTLNNEILDRNYITQEEIMQGGTLQFMMTNRPPVEKK
ncbi:MAG: glycoside hydrolase family 92 protein, partial [Bacteroidales bacterium]|nr:glycoside hydrolase family 92 protein [Bacteroidales bacterium]